jgi:hypothetical protein
VVPISPVAFSGIARVTKLITPPTFLRPITHGTGATHHVDAVEVARGNRRHRQLRLTVRRERCRYTIDQHGGARRQTRSQTAHADVEGNVTAAGAVGILHLHARHTLEHVADVHRALLDHRFAADHRARAGVVLHNGGVGITEPVADHFDVGHAQFQWTIAGGGSRGRRQRYRTFVDLVIQTAALQQLAQGLLRRDITVDCGRLFTGDQVRAEKHLQRSLLAQFAEGLTQWLRADMDRFASEGQWHGCVDRQRKGQRQPRGFFVVGRGVFHVVRSPVDRKSVRLLMQTSCS